MRTHALRLTLASTLLLSFAACDEATDTASTASVVASDQSPTPLTTVVIKEVTADVPGWIVIHQDDKSKYGAVLLGQTKVEIGTSDDVVVTLSRPCLDGETLHAMLHVDNGELENFEFPGADEPVLTESGLPVVASFVVSGGDPTPSVLVDNQFLDPANEVTVKIVTALADGRVAIYTENGPDNGEDPLGHTAVSTGSDNVGLTVTLSRDAANEEMLLARLETEAGEPIDNPLAPIADAPGTFEPVQTLFTVSVVPCAPECTDKACGDDGCGGSCGDCGDGETCDDAGACEAACTPECTDLDCGDDGCGGSCGDCGDDETCNDAGACEAACTPECTDLDCGDDGCGGSCGDCGDDETCNDAGACEAACTPDCTDLDCGDDGCGGSCGDCDDGEFCNDDSVCAASPCTCTTDDCDGVDDVPCPAETLVCFDSFCCSPLVECGAEITCGPLDDGCGGTLACGDCTGDDVCTDAGVCETAEVANACDAAPCLNGGACTDGGDGTSYTCDCTGTGFTGDDCETDLCDGVDCGTGTCDATTDTAVCDCTGTGFTGDNCELADVANACNAAPCQNSGACTDGGDGTTYTCDCTGTGFTGDDCETNLCAGVDCGTGTCDATTDTAVCDCTGTGFTGDSCETDLCAGIDCGTGTCDGTTGVAVCDCTGTGFTGDDCGTVDACTATPCLNSGVCTDGGDGTSYTCDCTGTGFIGDDCEAAEVTATCAADWAECTEADFDANDKTAEAGTIAITMNAFAPYSPTCLRVKAGQTVSIQATEGHPFESVCAEDTVMDGTTGETANVEVTLTTPGYYNYRCQLHPGSMVGNIQVVP